MKTKGARPVLDRLYGIANAISNAAAHGHKQAIYNSPYAQKKLAEIQELAIDLKQVIEEQVEPFMERAAPRLEQRLADLERRIETLENE